MKNYRKRKQGKLQARINRQVFYEKRRSRIIGRCITVVGLHEPDDLDIDLNRIYLNRFAMLYEPEIDIEGYVKKKIAEKLMEQPCP